MTSDDELASHNTPHPSPRRRFSRASGADDASAFTLFTTDAPSEEIPAFNGSELLALDPAGGGTLQICGLTLYRARWMRTLDVSLYEPPTSHRVARPASGASANEGCLDLTNPDPKRGKLLHVRRSGPDPASRKPDASARESAVQ